MEDERNIAVPLHPLQFHKNPEIGAVQSVNYLHLNPMLRRNVATWLSAIDYYFLIWLLLLMPIQVVIIDEQQLFSDALSHLIDQAGEFQVLACFDNHHEALSHLGELKPDVILCDIKARFHQSEDIFAEMAQYTHEFNFLVLTGYAESSDVMACLQSGIKGFILKNQPHDELFFALKRIASGGVHYCMEAQAVQLRSYDKTPFHPFGLTVREKEILQLLCEDQTPKDIARKLNVDRKTVDSHKRNIFQKLGIQTMTQLVKFGLQHDLIAL
jgi:DNA-binding NarL/FixJ family response regulator